MMSVSQRWSLPVTSDLEIFLHDVHHHCELREDEHPVSIALHPRQQVIQQSKLARLTNDVVTKTQMLYGLKEDYFS